MQLNRIRTEVIVNIPDNFNQDDIDAWEESVLSQLSSSPEITGVIVDLSALRSTDVSDLERLNQMLECVHLLGRRVALAGISPGLAALMVHSRVELFHDRIGCDIDDILEDQQPCWSVC